MEKTLIIFCKSTWAYCFRRMRQSIAFLRSSSSFSSWITLTISSQLGAFSGRFCGIVLIRIASVSDRIWVSDIESRAGNMVDWRTWELFLEVYINLSSRPTQTKILNVFLILVLYIASLQRRREPLDAMSLRYADIEPPRFAWQTEPPLCRPSLRYADRASAMQ